MRSQVWHRQDRFVGLLVKNRWVSLFRWNGFNTGLHVWFPDWRICLRVTFI